LIGKKEILLTLILILIEYFHSFASITKPKNNAGGRIRDLKKKDVENLVKRLELER
jgi:hypothetical protein